MTARLRAEESQNLQLSTGKSAIEHHLKSDVLVRISARCVCLMSVENGDVHSSLFLVK